MEKEQYQNRLNRRSFIKVTALAAGGLSFGFTLPGCATMPEMESSGELVFDAWLKLLPNNRWEFTSSKTEMGQNTYTALLTLLAEEMNTHPKFFDIKTAPIDSAYNGPGFPFQLTGGSTSVMALYEPLRAVGATVKNVLERGGKYYFKSENVKVEDGFVFSSDGKQKVSYAELIPTLAEIEVVEVKPQITKDFKYIGKAYGKRDYKLREKVTGQVKYAIDEHANFLVGVIERPPVFAAKFLEMDITESKKVKGFDSAHVISRGVVILAKDYYSAQSARRALKVKWDMGEYKTLSSKEIMSDYKKIAFDDDGSGVFSRGDIDDGKEIAGKKIDAEFEFPYLAHATLEPQNCAASYKDGVLDVWAPTQAQSVAHEAAAKAAGLSRSDGRIHTSEFLGGAFGRRNHSDFVIEAAETAMVSKKSVKIIWSREDDMRHSPYRPLYFHRVQAGVQKDGQPAFWKQNLVGQGILIENGKEFGATMAPNWLPRFMKNFTGSVAGGAMDLFTVAPTSVEGANKMPYSIPHVDVKFSHQDQPVPVTFWRSVGHTYTAYVKETIIDDLATLARKDPLIYRRSLLSQDKRHLRVLDRLEKFSQWNKPAKKNHYKGLAIHESFASVVGQVCEISIDENQRIVVHKVYCVVDCGRAVDPDNVKAQMEGGIIYGMNHVLYNNLDIVEGKVSQGNFDSYPLLRLNESPEILVDVMDLDEKPTGVGEPAVPVIGPAISNAVFRATGLRLRKLPLKLP